MDWFSWLSKTSLHPSLVHQYALAFYHNQLEEEDIVHFNHEFLQSMGLSIAKHRLQILKLARKHTGMTPRPLSMLLLAIDRTKRSLAKFIGTLVCRPRSRSGYANKWKRNKKLMLLAGTARVESFSSPMDGEEDEDGYWSTAVVADIRWDTMFQDLKPN